MSRKAILLTGGYSHPFEDSSPALAALIAEAGLEPHLEGDIDTAVAMLAEGPALLAVNALHWSMVQHEKYAPDRAAYAYALPYQHMNAIEQYVSGGGRLHVQHVGTICFDTQPRWHRVMGGGWSWGRSHHPPMGKMRVQLSDAGAKLSAGPDAFELLDEAYHNLDPAEDCTVLATCEIEEGPQPLAWIRTFGEGRVAVDALGHDARSINAPGHRELIAAQLEWLKETGNA
ncbi:ThuA domain-containing protein [Paraurantiacibacter namhicola]|uniref:Trehalose utilization n=1 Tax=Paraurantiacibacter namhicola TaxID=645517 RepID=A0A1C7DAH6_9SPHN|nr:ThuA domain-containing protein [Paraurantiacibacter namhicola]ANU08417.1 Trehalose utilization [Paraurantiacibacter namhicola]